MVRFILFNLHIHFQIHTFSCPLYIDKLNIFYYKLHSFQFLQYMNLEGKVISPDNIEGWMWCPTFQFRPFSFFLTLSLSSQLPTLPFKSMIFFFFFTYRRPYTRSIGVPFPVLKSCNPPFHQQWFNDIHSFETNIVKVNTWSFLNSQVAHHLLVSKLLDN